MVIADILFVGAEPREFTGIVSSWTALRPLALPVHWARSGKWKGANVVAIANGAGPLRSKFAASSVPHKTLVSVGYCGALDPKLEIGDIVTGQDCLQPATAKPHFTGKIASIERIAGTPEEKRRLHATGAIAVEMELNGLIPMPFYCVKAVSDLAGETFANDFNAVLQPDGRMSVSKLLWHAAADPLPRFSELIRLARRSKLVAEKLGEFVESCEF